VTEIVVRAPASTANLGPGFDCAAAALDLWNEMRVEERTNGGPWVTIEGEGADELPRDERHLSLRAFAAFAPPDAFCFRFLNRIPVERGLGSSAAAIAAGLVAGAAVARPAHDDDGDLALGARIERHVDNLAAALRGGVCLTWGDARAPHAARVAADLPFAAVLVVPDERGSTAYSRSRLPFTIAHADAAAAASRAALLGAALAAGDGAMLRDAFDDERLHEPYRAASAPLLARVRDALPDGAAGATLSGSGPSIVVWAEKSRRDEVVAELEARFADTRVLPLAVAERGATAA
jgi:homoserine kinase